MKRKNLTKLLSVALIAVMLCMAFPISIFADTGENPGGEITDEKAKLSSLLVFTASSETPTDSNVLLKNADDSFTTDKVFDPEVLTYELGPVNDRTGMLGFIAEVEAGETMTLYFTAANGSEKSVKLTSGNLSRPNCMFGGVNEYRIVVTPASGDSTLSTTYEFTVICNPTLKSLSAQANGSSLTFDKDFKGLTDFEYTLTLPENTKEVVFSAAGKNSAYTISYDGSSESTVNVEGKDKVEIVVSAEGIETLYVINLERTKAEGVSFDVTPEDAIVSVYNQENELIFPDENGVYTGMFGTYTYTYTVSKTGYITQSGTINATDSVIKVDLVKSSDSTLTDVGAQWKNFRGSDYNMAIVDIKTPIDAESTSLLWNKKVGSDWNAAPSVQIIADDALITMVGSTLYKLDLETGEILDSAEMAEKINWGYTPPTYAEGIIFCPIANGTVQAFNAETLESLWVYQDPLKGQSLTPVYYNDGYVYTGFWNSEFKDANYVCLSVTDEDPTLGTESKTATWKITHTGGYYWCGAVAVGDYVIFGAADSADEGIDGTSYLYCVNKTTGKVIEKVSLENAGDVRSSIAYDEEEGRIYLSTTGGYLYGADIDKTTGDISNLKYFDMGEASTTTPVVYKGRIYTFTHLGFTSGHMYIADAETMELILCIDTEPVQCSPLLTTAYEDTGYLYLYCSYNKKPGGINLYKVKTDASTADDVTEIELYNANGFSEHCIASIICSDDGTLYYKNDSCNVLAVGIPSYQNVIDLIDAIGTVDTESKTDIETARSAYEALSEDDKAKVTNYDKLTAAEKEFDEVMAKETVVLIDAIGDDITEESEDAITKARAAYDALSEVQKGKVPVEKLEKLINAENALQKLKDNKPEGATKGITVTINGITYVISEETKAAIDAMQAVLDSENPTEEEIMNAYNTYAALTYNEKLFANNYKDFEEKILSKLGDENHYDKVTETDARDNEESALPWYVKLVVENVGISQAHIDKVKETLGENAKLENMYDISFVNTLTNEKWIPDELIKIKLPAKGSSLGSYAIVHINANEEYGFIQPVEEEGNLVFESMDFSYYGVATFEGTWDDLLGKEEVQAKAVVWPWAIGGAAGVGGLLWVILGKRKEEEE